MVNHKEMPATSAIVEMMEEGVISKELLILRMLFWMGEKQVQLFAEEQEYI